MRALQLSGSYTGYTFALAQAADGSTLVTAAACYCPGTLILTDRGEMPVETWRSATRWSPHREAPPHQVDRPPQLRRPVPGGQPERATDPLPRRLARRRPAPPRPAGVARARHVPRRPADPGPLPGERDQHRPERCLERVDYFHVELDTTTYCWPRARRRKASWTTTAGACSTTRRVRRAVSGCAGRTGSARRGWSRGRSWRRSGSGWRWWRERSRRRLSRPAAAVRAVPAVSAAATPPSDDPGALPGLHAVRDAREQPAQPRSRQTTRPPARRLVRMVAGFGFGDAEHGLHSGPDTHLGRKCRVSVVRAPTPRPSVTPTFSSTFRELG